MPPPQTLVGLLIPLRSRYQAEYEWSFSRPQGDDIVARLVNVIKDNIEPCVIYLPDTDPPVDHHMDDTGDHSEQ